MHAAQVGTSCSYLDKVQSDVRQEPCSNEGSTLLKSDYSVGKASAETIEAMKDRCTETDHVWENACSILFQLYQVCKWCGVTRGGLG